MNYETSMQYEVPLRFFSQILQFSPTEMLLRHIVQKNLFKSLENWSCFQVPAKAMLAEYRALEPANALQKLVNAYSLDRVPVDDVPFFQTLHLDLHMEHLALFSGPSPKSPPWESVWREREKLLFGEHTEKVSRFYQNWGISIENAGQEPEDHLGLELAFVLFLLQTMHNEPSCKSRNNSTPHDALVDFLDHHILPWAGLCLNKAAENATTAFYRSVPVLCSSMLCNLRNALTVHTYHND